MNTSANYPPAPQRPGRNYFWRRIMITAIVAGCLAQIIKHIEVITSESIDKRILWLTSEQPGPNDYVNFDLLHPLAGEKSVNITKRLTCYAGQYLEADGRNVYCDGKWLGSPKEKSLTDKPLPKFIYYGAVPPGYGFVTGTHQHSFDSRYWGFVDLSKARRAIPII